MRFTIATESVTYNIFYEECGIEVAAYIGETGRNGFSRDCEHCSAVHWDNLDAKDEEKSCCGVTAKPTAQY